MMSITKPDYYLLAGGKDLLSIIPPEERLIFCKWSAMKYLTRVGKKETAKEEDDLSKTQRYVEVMQATLKELKK